MRKLLDFIRKIIYWIQKKCGYGKITHIHVYSSTLMGEKYRPSKTLNVGDTFRHTIPPHVKRHGKITKIIAIESIHYHSPMTSGQKLTIREI